MNLIEPEPLSATQLREVGRPRRAAAPPHDCQARRGHHWLQFCRPEALSQTAVIISGNRGPPPTASPYSGAQLYHLASPSPERKARPASASEVQDNAPTVRASRKHPASKSTNTLLSRAWDPRVFDLAPFAGLVEAVAASGIRFTTLAEEGDRGRRRNCIVSTVEPTSTRRTPTEAFPDFATLNALFDTVGWFRVTGKSWRWMGSVTSVWPHWVSSPTPMPVTT
ncbi:MAG: hypothetical protein IPM76_18655 [Chloroflexi bacterium]|nr:hypothetical protein [Chloroflexota bacterium]